MPSARTPAGGRGPASTRLLLLGMRVAEAELPLLLAGAANLLLPAARFLCGIAPGSRVRDRRKPTRGGGMGKTLRLMRWLGTWGAPLRQQGFGSTT
eukprot:COSAG01_NODE_27130_length_693_cov_1.483165_2_plen_95_part_01